MNAAAAENARTAAIVGAGPAGLMAAEILIAAGVGVDVYDRMPSVGRKLLMAGKGGLNITHSERPDAFLGRYGARREALRRMLESFGPEALREWVHALGISTFVGTSGRVFPHEMKAAPLLRAWLHRLRESGVRIHVRHRWQGWDEGGALRFVTPGGERNTRHDAAVLAVGGASWPQLGSDGAWVPLLAERGIPTDTLRPANCGFDVEWSEHFRMRFAGHPVKPVVATYTDAQGIAHRRQGEFVVTESGLEGGLIYAVSTPLRKAIETTGKASLTLDLAPGHDVARLTAELSRPRGSRSMASHIQSRTGLKGVKTGLLREVLPPEAFADPQRLASTIKALTLTLVRPRPLEEAISTAGGVPFEALDEHLMVKSLPGVFCAGEMLDWEAPTGGYLLTACLATGRTAGLGAAQWLETRATTHVADAV
jgi:uncharacterized flavoprotein (TIGR03862 family)